MTFQDYSLQAVNSVKSKTYCRLVGIHGSQFSFCRFQLYPSPMKWNPCTKCKKKLSLSIRGLHSKSTRIGPVLNEIFSQYIYFSVWTFIVTPREIPLCPTNGKGIRRTAGNPPPPWVPPRQGIPSTGGPPLPSQNHGNTPSTPSSTQVCSSISCLIFQLQC